MANSHQTHLGSTAAKLLTIVDPQGPPVWPWTIIQPKEAHILHKLPDELLLLIVKTSCYNHFPSEMSVWAECEGVIVYDTSCVMALSHVCHRFKRIAQPLLFSAVTLGLKEPMVPASIPALKLHRTLSERADLRQHCRYLCITMNDRDLTRTSAHYKVVKDFVSWLSNTKRLYIRDVSNRCDRNFSTCRLKDCKNNEILTWDLVCHAAAWMKQVEHFGIDRGNCDVDLELVVKWLDFSKLRSLEVRKIEYNEKAKQHEEKQRTARFTRLNLHMPKAQMRVIPLLIQWPAVLTHFTFEAYSDTPHTLNYAMMETWLLAHKETLLHVDICCDRPEGSKPFFDASLFPKLEYLQLWRWPRNIRAEHCVSETVSLLGPGLQTFCWNYGPPTGQAIDDYGSPPLGENEILWIQALARSAFERKATLKTIVVKYTLGIHLRCRQLIDYPWDHLKTAKDYMSKLGIDLVYDDPWVSKDEWMSYYKTGKDPYGKFLGHTDQGVLVYVEATEREEEEETRLEQLHENFLREPMYHGEDMRKYLLT